METKCPFRMRKMPQGELECEIDYTSKKHTGGILRGYCMEGDCMYYPDSECPLFNKLNEYFTRR